MTVEQFFSDILHGNFTHAASRLADWYNGWPAPLKAFVSKLTDDEGMILWNAAQTALAGGFAGKPINDIADSLWEIIKSQVPTKAKSDLLDVLGVLIRQSASSQPPAS